MIYLFLLFFCQEDNFLNHEVVLVELYDLSDYSSLTEITPEAGREIGTQVIIKGFMAASSIWRELDLGKFSPIKEKPAFFPSFILDLTLKNGEILTFYGIGNWVYDKAMKKGRKVNSHTPKCFVTIKL